MVARDDPEVDVRPPAFVRDGPRALEAESAETVGVPPSRSSRACTRRVVFVCQRWTRAPRIGEALDREHRAR